MNVTGLSLSHLFQSTLPVRGATLLSCIFRYMITFQSTLPVRGATTALRPVSREQVISIHAPREGSDRPKQTAQRPDISISIHAPREGSDTVLKRLTSDARISIHAPREGSDHVTQREERREKNFNPRSP